MERVGGNGRLMRPRPLFYCTRSYTYSIIDDTTESDDCSTLSRILHVTVRVQSIEADRVEHTVSDEQVEPVRAEPLSRTALWWRDSRDGELKRCERMRWRIELCRGINRI